MPSPQTLEAFIAEVEAGRYVDAIERFYADDAFMRENGDAPRVGREVLMQGEREVMARFGKITCRIDGPPLSSGDHVAIRWRFGFETKDGAHLALDEIAWQTWRGEKIAEEIFFYDPKQLGR